MRRCSGFYSPLIPLAMLPNCLQEIKKALQTDSFEGLHPAYLTLVFTVRNHFRVTAQRMFKAGLLALGSAYFLRLPISFVDETVALQISSPITAAGPLPNFTGFPIKPTWHLVFLLLY